MLKNMLKNRNNNFQVTIEYTFIDPYQKNYVRCE